MEHSPAGRPGPATPNPFPHPAGPGALWGTCMYPTGAFRRARANPGVGRAQPHLQAVVA